jgi:hypothetical protein
MLTLIFNSGEFLQLKKMKQDIVLLPASLWIQITPATD